MSLMVSSVFLHHQTLLYKNAAITWDFWLVSRLHRTLYFKQLDSIVVGMFPKVLKPVAQILLDDEVHQWMVSVCPPSKAQLLLKCYNRRGGVDFTQCSPSSCGIHKHLHFTGIHRRPVLWHFTNAHIKVSTYCSTLLTSLTCYLPCKL